MLLNTPMASAPYPPRSTSELTSFEQQISVTPAANQVHGMYLVSLRQLLKSRAIARRELQTAQPFRYYPLQLFMRELVAAATLVYPEATPRDSLRRLGKLVCPTFAESIGGKVMMGVVGRNLELGLSVLARGYHLSLRPGRAIVVKQSPGHWRVELREIWNFGDTYQVGVVQGLMDWCRVRGEINPEVISPCDTDLDVRWDYQ